MRDGTLNMAMNGIEDGEKVNPDGKKLTLVLKFHAVRLDAGQMVTPRCVNSQYRMWWSYAFKK